MSKTWDRPYSAHSPTPGFVMLDTLNMDEGWDKMPDMDLIHYLAPQPSSLGLPSVAPRLPEKADRRTLSL